MMDLERCIMAIKSCAPPSCGHMSTFQLLGKRLSFPTSCQAPHNPVRLPFAIFSASLSPKVSGETGREGWKWRTHSCSPKEDLPSLHGGEGKPSRRHSFTSAVQWPGRWLYECNCQKHWHGHLSLKITQCPGFPVLIIVIICGLYCRCSRWAYGHVCKLGKSALFSSESALFCFAASSSSPARPGVCYPSQEW